MIDCADRQGKVAGLGSPTLSLNIQGLLECHCYNVTMTKVSPLTYGVIKAALVNPLITHELAGETVLWEQTGGTPTYRDTHNRSNCGKYTGQRDHFLAQNNCLQLQYIL